MISLKEILHTVKEESKKGLTPVDNWNLLHATFLEDMDFKADGTYHYSLAKPPILISHKKGVGFVLEDKLKEQIHTFKDFNELTEFFTKYEQEWENAPYKESEDEKKRKELEKTEPRNKPNTVREDEKNSDVKDSVKKWEKM